MRSETRIDSLKERPEELNNEIKYTGHLENKTIKDSFISP